MRGRKSRWFSSSLYLISSLPVKLYYIIEGVYIQAERNMGGNGKHRWKFSFRSSSSSMSKQPPKEFMCPISGSLMADPVVVSSGHTFERISVEVCRSLGFVPALGDGSRPDFTTVVPNLNIRTAIQNWCAASRVVRPREPEYGSVLALVSAEMGLVGDGRIEDSEKELLRAVPNNPPVMFSHAATEVNHRPDHFNSSSSEESVIAAVPATPLPLTTRPSCYSSFSSSSDEALGLTGTVNPISPEEEEILGKLKSSEVHEQEEGVTMLRKITRTKESTRVSLCTTQVLDALKPLVLSKYAVVQTNAAASVVNLSIEKANKKKILRSGIVPPLIDLLKWGVTESQEHAAGALFSLALEDDNRTGIGVLGALQPLLHALRSGTERTRQDSAMALYNLSFDQNNRVKLVRLGAIPTLLAMVKSGDLVGRALLILCNLAAFGDGRSVMLDANAVGCLVELLRGKELDSESTEENCVAVLYLLSRGSMRFKGLAREARAIEVLREVQEKGTERAREKAKKMLQMMRGREEDEAMDGDGVLESGALSQPRLRAVRQHLHGAYSTEF